MKNKPTFMKLFKYIVFMFLLIISSCKKKIDLETRPEFIGYWVTTPLPGHYISIEITEDSKVSFFNELTGKSIKGTFRANDNAILIGTHKFKIIEYPHVVDIDTINNTSRSLMKIEGPFLLGADGNYQKFDD